VLDKEGNLLERNLLGIVEDVVESLEVEKLTCGSQTLVH
jgi:hypothetical protein